MTEIDLIDSGADMNSIRERLIPFKYFGKSSKRLIQANGKKIINHKLPRICNNSKCFEAIKDLSSKVVLIFPFLETDEGIATNVPFILPFIPKEVYSLNNITILKDIDKERIYRTERSLSSLKP